MITALKWILNKLEHIAQQFRSSSSADAEDCIMNADERNKLFLLEMYCGCGAHTMPIALSGLFDMIVCVELDQRLVDACIENAALNNCRYNGGVSCCSNDTKTLNRDITPVHVQQGDAGQWATKALTRSYHALLVDPPRAGLDKTVCDMVQQGPFEHLLYISCGRKALTKDLANLNEGGFDVVDIVVTDLFPHTDAVESLVHLKRRSA